MPQSTIRVSLNWTRLGWIGLKHPVNCTGSSEDDKCTRHVVVVLMLLLLFFLQYLLLMCISIYGRIIKCKEHNNSITDTCIPIVTADIGSKIKSHFKNAAHHKQLMICK